MKKFLGILFLALLLNGCDDGDATVEQISFDESNIVSCPYNKNLIFKITENRVMIVNLTSSETTFENNPGSRSVAIGSGAAVTYRVYSGALNSETLCNNPAPITPVAILEWPATRGTMEVTTTIIPNEPNTETGQVTIKQYRHAVVLRNLELTKSDGTTQVLGDYPLGNYITTPENTLSFDFLEDNPLAKCPSANTVYNATNIAGEGMYIQNLDTATLLNSTILNTPKTVNIGSAQNTLVYRLFDGSIASGQNENYFCNGAATPGTKEEWVAIAGTIEVVTVTNTPGYKHTFRLKNVTFKKKDNNSTFYFGNDMLFGELLTLD